MDKSRGRASKKKSHRDSGRFIAIPCQVIDCDGYAKISHTSKSLLLEIARQYNGSNNGRLLCSSKYLWTRGWKSNDVITRAKRELLEHGFIYQTVQGHRPNKASWFAITWNALDKIPGYDYGAEKGFQRSAYQNPRQEKNTKTKPHNGANCTSVVPSPSTEGFIPIPQNGAAMGKELNQPIPSYGDHIEKPSAQREVRTYGF